MKPHTFNILPRWIAIAATIVALAAAFAATAGAQTIIRSNPAGATTVPAHWYTLSCPRVGYWGDYIEAQVTRLETQPGVGMSIVDGTGTLYPSTQQFIYFRLVAHNDTYGGWIATNWKRSRGVYPGVGLEDYDTSVGLWMPAFQTVISSSLVYTYNGNLMVGPDQVAIRVQPGSGTYTFYVETYWAPPTLEMTMADLTNRYPAPGGLDVLDWSPQTCTF